MTIRADRVQETTSTTGTGTLTLAGAVAAYQAFSAAFSTGSLVEYAILSGTDWEVGLGTYTTSGTTLTRDIVLRSSNSGSKISVASGAFVWSNVGSDTFTSSVQPFRNRIYNGAWRFDQVNEGTAYTCAAGSTTQAMDGWSAVMGSPGVISMQRVADPDNASLYALKIACTTADNSIAAGDLYYIQTAIEGYDVADMKLGTASAAQITISFDMKMDVTGTYGISLFNSALSRGYVGTVTQNVASTNESKTVTLMLDNTGTWLYTNGVGLYLRFTLAAGSTYQVAAGTWANSSALTTSSQCNFMSANTNVGYIKRIQLEKGPVATPFEEMSIVADLVRTQRYAEKSYEQGTAVATSTLVGTLLTPYMSANSSWGGILFKTPKRAAPAMTGWTSGGLVGNWTDLIAGATSITFNSIAQNSVLYVTPGIGTSQGVGHWYADARLS